MFEKMLFDAIRIIGGVSLFVFTGYAIAAITLYLNPENLQ